jgi:hypothetical protein
MGYEQRKAIVAEIEKKRNSKIISLITSDRLATTPILGIQGQISSDQVSQLFKHLKAIEEKFPETKIIDLFIHSSGGDVNTAWPFVNAIRNYSEEFNVLIPVKAHSSATLISLGANNIIMSKTASLSPVDPTVTNAFNPKENNQPQGISVEDVTSFIALAKSNEIKNEKNITDIFKILSEKVHPLALGNVKRSHTQIRQLAKNLLQMNMDEKSDSKIINKIVNSLTQDLNTHSHSIFRKEAAETIGLKNIVEPDASLEKLLWDLYKDYEEEMQLNKIFDINMFMGNDNEKLLETTTILMESSEISSKFEFKQNLVRSTNQDPNFRLQLLLNKNQVGNNAKIVKSQIAQIHSSINTMYAQILPLINGNPTVPALQALPQQYQTILNQVDQLQAAVPSELDMSILNQMIEQKIQNVGWNN